MASSSQCLSRAAITADTAAAATAADQVRGAVIGSQCSEPVTGAITPSSARFGRCRSSPRAPLACMCIHGYVVLA